MLLYNIWFLSLFILSTIIHSVKTIEKLKVKDLDMVDNINKLKNQILYNNTENEI